MEKVHFLIMGNMLNTIPREYIHNIYDLKGSTHNRQVLKDEEIHQSADSGKTLKDLDFDKLEQQIWISVEDRKAVVETIEKDVQFLN